MDGDRHLGRPAPVRARAQPVADPLLDPPMAASARTRFRVAGCVLPGCTCVLGDARQMAVPLRGRGRLARHGRGPWRHDDRRLRMAVGDGGGSAWTGSCNNAAANPTHDIACDTLTYVFAEIGLLSHDTHPSQTNASPTPPSVRGPREACSVVQAEQTLDDPFVTKPKAVCQRLSLIKICQHAG